MIVRELIIQLLNEDMDADISIEVGTNTLRDFEGIEGIANNIRSSNGVVVVPTQTLQRE